MDEKAVDNTKTADSDIVAQNESNPQVFSDNILSLANENDVDFLHLSKEAWITLGTGSDALYSGFEKWRNVVKLSNLIFGGRELFQLDSPSWLQAGFLFADICIQRCEWLSRQPIPSNITRNGEIISPTYPHDYLGYARRCFNSGIGSVGHDGHVYISPDDWLACQPKYYPTRQPDLSLCKRLAEDMKKKGQRLLIAAPPHDAERPLNRAARRADALIALHVQRDTSILSDLR